MRTGPADLADALLPWLQRELAAPALSFHPAPEPIAIGVETWVYGLGLEGAPDSLASPLVLRLFPERTSPLQARFEATVQNHLADAGYPAPRVPLVCEDAAVLGGPFVLIERVEGRMQLDALIEGRNVLRNAPAQVVP